MARCMHRHVGLLGTDSASLYVTSHTLLAPAAHEKCSWPWTCRLSCRHPPALAPSSSTPQNHSPIHETAGTLCILAPTKTDLVLISFRFHSSLSTNALFFSSHPFPVHLCAPAPAAHTLPCPHAATLRDFEVPTMRGTRVLFYLGSPWYIHSLQLGQDPKLCTTLLL